MPAGISERPGQSPLPRSWSWERLGDIATLRAGQAVPSETYTATVTAMPFLQGNAEFGDLYPTPEKRTTRPRTIVPKNAILLSVRAPVGATNLAPTQVAIGRGLVGLLPKEGLETAYLLWAIRSRRSILEKEATGTTFDAVTVRVVKDLLIPVPPPQVQRTIALHLDHLLRRIGTGRDYLTDGTRGVGWLRQRVVDQMTQSGAKVMRLADLLREPLANGRSVRTAVRGFPVLRLTSLKDGSIDLSEVKIGEWTADEAQRFSVKGGDFLVSRGNGSLRLVGRGGLVPESPSAVAFPDTLIRIRVDPELVRSEYLKLAWHSSGVRSAIEAQARTTAGIYKINQRDLTELRIPVPGLEEQDILVAEANRRLKRIKELGHALEQCQSVAGVLERAALEHGVLGGLFQVSGAGGP